jgi:hypothetical protein
VLDRLRQEPVLILGTITAQRYGRIEASDNKIGRSARPGAGPVYRGPPGLPVDGP